MPNYLVHEIEAFKTEKKQEENKVVRATPKKQPMKSSSGFTFNSKFTHEHAVDEAVDESFGEKIERVYRGVCGTGVDESQPKWTLANDSEEDQEYAKMYLFRQLSSPEGEELLQKFEKFEAAKSKSETRQETFAGVVMEALHDRFDVGQDFIDGWDLERLCTSVLACVTVLGKGTGDASHSKVLERHEEILQVLLCSSWMPTDKQKMISYAEKLEDRAKQQEAELQEILPTLDEYGERRGR